MTIRHHMIDNADGLRTAAVQRRNKGWATGKAAKGHDWQRGNKPEHDTWAAAWQAAHERWRADCGEVRNTYAVACMSAPGSTEADNDIPF